jgi:hypothetical protein
MIKINTLQQDSFITIHRGLDNTITLYYYDDTSFEGKQIKLKYEEIQLVIKALRTLFYAYSKEPIQLPFILFCDNVMVTYKQLSQLIVELILLKLEIKKVISNETT